MVHLLKQCGVELLLIVLLALLTSGCRTKYVAVPQMRSSDSLLTSSRVLHDSIVRHDSVVIREYYGDTIRIVEHHFHYLSRDRQTADTLQSSRSDSLSAVPSDIALLDVEHKTPAKVMPWYSIVALTFSATILLLLLLFFVLWLRSPRRAQT